MKSISLKKTAGIWAVLLVVFLIGCSKETITPTPLNVWIRNCFSPDNDLGRINSIVINPLDSSVVYIGAQEACVIKNKYYKDHLTSEFMSMPGKYEIAVPLRRAIADPASAHRLQYLECLTMDPKNPKVLYTGFAGIFKSEDGGKNWKQVYNMPTVYSIAIDPDNPSTIYAGTEMEGVIKSSDGGKTWTQVLSGHYFSTLLIDQRTNSLFAGDFSGLSKSTDGGANWTKLTDKFITSLVIHPTNSSILYGAFTGNALGTEEIFKSTDGGSTWAQITKGLAKNASLGALAPKIPLVIDPKNPSTLYVGTMGGGVFKSIDGGLSWQELNEGLTNKVIFSLAIDPKNPSIVFAGTENGEMFRIVQTK